MEKSKVKEILIKAGENSDGTEKDGSCRRVYSALCRRTGDSELNANFYLVREAYSQLRGVDIAPQLRYYAGILFPLMTAESISDCLAAFFEAVSDSIDGGCSIRIREALMREAIMSLGRGEDSSVCLSTLRALLEFDFAPFILGYAPEEQILRRDPAGIYQKMDRESRELYKQKIREYSQKRGITFVEGCERLVNEACEKGCHIGELLSFKKGSPWAMIFPFSLFLVLTGIVFFALKGNVPITIRIIVTCLSTVPLWQGSLELFVPIMARYKKSEILPRLDLSVIPPEYATLTVITAMCNTPEETERIFHHLESVSLKLRSRGKGEDSAYWGVLLDLPECIEEKSTVDKKVLKAAKKEIDRLNSQYSSRFVLFTRERRWNETEKKYIPYERKRGAVIGLTRSLKGKDSELVRYGCQLPDIRYVLTLDSDTDTELGALNKMVGTMAHPLNAPKIGIRNGVPVTVEGYGILQPALAGALESVYKTGFSILTAGVGGVDIYHSAIFNLHDALFGRGVFCGKGMFDVEVFDRVIDGAFKDGAILSHDILEGTRLRTGYLPDVTFFDSVPSNAMSYYNRAHRWARGDVQSLAFVGKYLQSAHGRVRNPMLMSERFVFAMNLFTLLSPIFQVLGLFFMMWYGVEMLTTVSFLLLLPNLTPLFNTVVSAISQRSLKNIRRRFFGDSVTVLCRELLMLGYRSASLAFIAYKNADAALRAVWRMRVSGKKLLEWTTASQSERLTGSLLSFFIYTFPSFVTGVFMLFFARLSLCKLLGILWCVFFLLAYSLSKRRHKSDIGKDKKKRLIRYARDVWRYFDKYTDATGNHLPPDNVSVFPSSETAYRTSPTNIGLYLVSVLAARDFGFITLDELAARLENTLSTIERLPKYKGQLYNWYSTVTLEVIGQEYISTVDCGNFIACLVALYQGLEELERGDKRIKEIRTRIKAIETASEFRFLYNHSRNLFSLGYFADTEKQDPIVYDMYMSEARTTDYYAVARGIVRDTHWASLSRPIIASARGIGVLSWSGTAFEYFMPHLFLPVYRNSLTHEALSFTLSEQIKNGVRIGKERVFGISESGYFAFDEALNYQYRAFGVPSLSRRRDGEGRMVISPYSSFLMLRSAPSYAINNLSQLEKLGMYGECGFYEALDVSATGIKGRPSVVKSFMSHHLGMSFIAIANAVYQDVFVKRFMSDPEMAAVSELLKESVPTDAVSVKKNKVTPNLRTDLRQRPHFVPKENPFRTEASMWALTGREGTAVLFERGIVSLDATVGKDKSISIFRPIDVTNKTALFVYCRDKDRISSPSLSDDVSFCHDAVYSEYKQGELKATFSLSAKLPAARIRLEAVAEIGEVGMYFEPILSSLLSYSSHPAFSGLFFRAEYDGSVLVLSRTGEEPFSVAVVSNSVFIPEVSGEKLFSTREASPVEAVTTDIDGRIEELPLYPCVFVKSRFEKRTDTTFVIGWGRTKSEAVSNASEELASSFSRSVKKSRELFYSAVAASGVKDGYEEMFRSLLFAHRPETERKLFESLPKGYGKNAVYSMGISGELPIYLIKSGIGTDTLEMIFTCHKLHYIMGVRYDLLVEYSGEGYMAGGRGELEGLLESAGCAFLKGRRGGIHFADLSALPAGLTDTVANAVYPCDKRYKKYPAITHTKSVVAGTNGTVYGEFVINKSRTQPALLWSHVIASPTFGTMINHRSLGNTWAHNSRLSRITHWENDPFGGGYSEKLVMTADKEVTDMCAEASLVAYSAFSGEYKGRGYTLRVTVHPTLGFKAVSVELEPRNAELLYKLIPVLEGNVTPAVRIRYHSPYKNAVCFRNMFSESMSGFGYMYLPFERSVELTDEGFRVEREHGGEVLFILGYAGSQRHFDTVREYFSSNGYQDVLNANTKKFGSLIFADRLKSCTTASDKSFWLPYQVLVSRFFARSGPYQSGGAWGFRDQAQDCLALLDNSPDRVRAHICRMAAHQYLEGDVQHWWHPSKGVRTRCSDDLLWLVWLTCIYVLKTGDATVLDVKVSYLVSKPLSRGEKDRYESPSRTKERYSVAHHLKSSLDEFARRGLGDHSLPLILDGDWNDGMNMLPYGSESVWLGFFARIVIELYRRVTKDDGYTELSQRIRRGIEENAFFSDRYARAFLPDGRVMGIEGSEYMEIDALPQAFASICHRLLKDGDKTRIMLSLGSAWRELYDPQKRIFKLFTPPFKSFDREIGYLSAYPEGVRENGGQYTHAAAWAGLGFLYAPDDTDANIKRAEKLIQSLDPSTHNAHVYKGEPYVMAGDVYSNGHMGWSWYTGSAAWYRELILRYCEELGNNETT